MGNKRKRQVRGIKIQNINICMILISCILYVLLIVATVDASHRYKVMISAMGNYINCEEDAALVKEASDYLTEQVRLYTVTMDPVYVDRYFNEVYVEKRREIAMDQMSYYHTNAMAYEYFHTALENSDKLMEQEIYAMKLITIAQGYEMSDFPEDIREYTILEEDQFLSPDEMTEKARNLVFSSEYQKAKEDISGNVSYFLDNIIDNTMQEQQKSVVDLKRTMTGQQILISVLFVENILMFVLIILLVIKPLKIYIENIEDKEKLSVLGSYEFKYLALTYNNIYELNATNEAMLHYRAEHDPLTGIINRGAFDRLRQLLKGKQAPLALLIIDVDKFKQINDGFGHEMGDQVLKKVARLLEESFRSTDYIARIGGDEFAVIMTDVREDMKPLISDKIKQINDDLQHPGDDLAKTSLSVGIVFSSAGFPEDLYTKADKALYNVKENGRCGCVFYDEKE